MNQFYQLPGYPRDVASRVGLLNLSLAPIVVTPTREHLSPALGDACSRIHFRRTHMSQRALTTNTSQEHPYCVDYFIFMANAEADRLKEYEYADADVDSADDFYNRTISPPPNDDELPPQLSLDEFEDVFSNSDLVY